ncbi:sortase (plasmid) [Streptomyces globisporus]|uniref:sortase n=1 Tax=Streptomyces globisporus TaxID=1908 RepID=UPI002F91992E|nr:sortase [Streptomyces globisporus]
MRRSTSTPRSDDASTQDPGRPSRRQLITAAAGLAATALTFTALLIAQSGTGAHHPTADTPPPSATATAQPTTPSAPDPLISSSRPTRGAKPADHTGAARESASRTLADWQSGNPAAGGEHAVGGDTGRGPGGQITEVLRIPKLGPTWAQPVYDGIHDRQLRAGVGHFPGTEQPGQVGNFALAGHRSGVADPAFRDIDRITPGTAITVTTANRITYTYKVIRVRTVAPADVNVIAQVPGQPKATPTKAKLTLVTCWPADGHSKRVVVEADLVSGRGGA